LSKGTIIFILGPTSSGKTAVSVKAAKSLNGEVISCDSMQIYRGMDILTQAPLRGEMEDIPHHMVRVIDPREEYDAALFRDQARKIIERIIAKGAIPIISGGTGLYVKSLVDGIFKAPGKNEMFREQLKKEAEEKGAVHLHARLAKVDSDSAKKLHHNDLKRVIRAMEVYEITGKKLSDKSRETEGIASFYECRMFGMDLPREILYERVNAAVDKMFIDGLVDEVKGLIGKGLGRTACQALGIKEISCFLNDEISLEEAAEELKKNTRRYAKRQLTWFRADDRIEWIDANRDPSEVVKDIAERIRDTEEQ